MDKRTATFSRNGTASALADLEGWLRLAARSVAEWQAEYPPFEPHPSLRISDAQFTAAFDVFAERMRGNYPYFPVVRRADAEAAAPGRGRRVSGRDAGQPEQPGC
jgi:hypothetical protein